MTGFNRRQHITPVLASFYWLPVHFRIDFKILLMMKEHLGLASYIIDILMSYDPACSLKSSDGALLTILNLRLKTKGDHAFAIRAPQHCNALPEGRRLAR